MFLDGLKREGIVDSVLASPLEGGFKFLDGIGYTPLRASKESREKGPESVKTRLSRHSRRTNLKKHSYV